MAYKVVITEVTDVNGDGRIDLADVQYLLQNAKNVLSTLKGNGDFRSSECIELLKEADIVVTNPPFSLFREYVAQLMKYGKRFLIIGNQNAVSYKEIFPLLRDNKMWFGFHAGAQEFEVPQEYVKKNIYIKSDGRKFAKFGNICWFTNLDHKKRHEELILYHSYSADKYPLYDNYDAIEINQINNIPMDYNGIMGVPISILDQFNPDQFEIIGSNCSTELCKELGVKPLGADWIKRYRAAGGTGHNTANMVRIVYNDSKGKPKVAFSRIFIRNKTPQKI